MQFGFLDRRAVIGIFEHAVRIVATPMRPTSLFARDRMDRVGLPEQLLRTMYHSGDAMRGALRSRSMA